MLVFLPVFRVARSVTYLMVCSFAAALNKDKNPAQSCSTYFVPNPKHFLLLALAAGLLFSASAVQSAKVDDEKVAKIQAVCIFHMAQLVPWPASKFMDKDAPIVIGFIGDDAAFIAEYFTAQSKNYTAQGRKLLVKRFQLPDPKGNIAARVELFDKELREAHILFIGFQGLSKKHRILLEALTKSNVLTVGGASNFTDGGGMAALTVEKNKLVIRVNLASVRRSELKISAQFLQHAIIVKK